MKNGTSVFYNGYFTDSCNNWVIVKDGLVAGMGTGSPPVVGKAHLVNLRGQYVTPGLEDSHIHFYGVGLSLKRADLSHAKSKREAIDIVRLYLDKEPSRVLWGRGWNNNNWVDKKISFCDIPETDKFVILYRIDGHAILVNDKVLSYFGIHEAENPSGGLIERFEDGSPTGVLIDNAMGLVLRDFSEFIEEDLCECYKDANKKIIENGITRIHDMGINLSMFKVLNKLYDNKDLDVKTYAFFDSGRDIPEVLRSNCEKFEVGGLKLYADGAFGSKGACLDNNYIDGGSGFLLLDSDILKKNFEYAKKNKLQVAVHAIGDRAIKFVLKESDINRLRIEHVSMITEDICDLFIDKKAIASIQPCFYKSDIGWLNNVLSDYDIGKVYNFDKLVRRGIPFSVGTDSPVEPLNPIFNFRFAHEDYKFCISRADILKGYTQGAAFASCCEKKRGKIIEGFEGDFTFFSDDPLKANLDKLSITGVAISGEVLV